MLDCLVVQWLRGFVLAAVVVLLAGCGTEQEVLRVAVSGRVEMAGQPVRTGSISFLPEAGTSGPAANTAIQDGRYRFDRHTGPVPGSYRVLVLVAPEREDLSTKRLKAKGSARQKTRWEFHVVVPNEATFERDFELR